MDQYRCPNCKTKNDADLKYCTNCGTWLLSTTFPAKKVTRSAGVKSVGKLVGTLLSIIVIGAITLVGYANRDNFNTSGNVSTSNVIIEEIDVGGQYTLSQLTIDQKAPSATADFTPRSDIKDPLEVVAVFYDKSSVRLGKASALIDKALSAGQTTTITFTFDGATDISINKIANTRIEISALSPLMLMERMSEKAKKINSK